MVMSRRGLHIIKESLPGSHPLFSERDALLDVVSYIKPLDLIITNGKGESGHERDSSAFSCSYEVREWAEC